LCVGASLTDRKPTADQQFTNDLDQLLAELDQLHTRLTAVQQESLPTDVTQASDMSSRYEV